MKFRTIVTQIGFYSSIGFGVGYIPFASGTFGSLLAFPILILLNKLGQYDYYLLTTIILGTFYGIWSSEIGEIKLATKDPHPVVIDEVCGMMISMLFLPFTLKYAIVCFVIFRVLDIFKPWPCWRLQDLSGGWGIMLDDVVAGIYTCALVHILIWTSLL